MVGEGGSCFQLRGKLGIPLARWWGGMHQPDFSGAIMVLTICIGEMKCAACGQLFDGQHYQQWHMIHFGFNVVVLA